MKKYLEHPDLNKVAALTLLNNPGSLTGLTGSMSPATLLRIWENREEVVDESYVGMVISSNRLIDIWIRVRCEESRRTICLRQYMPMKLAGIWPDGGWINP